MTITPNQIKELRRRVAGLVTRDEATRQALSTDASIFSITPSAVLYPRTVQDIQETASYLNDQAAKGRSVGLVARGGGTDLSGGALGAGLVLSLPAHLNRLVKLTKHTVTVQAGMNYGALQALLRQAERWLPTAPASAQYSTVGGAVANNAAGLRSVKYGSTREQVVSLKVVLADGSLIETKRLSSRELSRKKGLMTLEGEIYRRIDSLIIDHAALIRQAQPYVERNTAGYALSRVKDKYGNFDLSQLFIGSQGTLGVVTEITLKTQPISPRTSLIIGNFDDLEKAGEAIVLLQKLNPSALELLDRHTLERYRADHPEAAQKMVGEESPLAMIMVEFDNTSQFRHNRLGRRARGIMKKYAASHRHISDRREQEAVWRMRQQAAASLMTEGGKSRAIPLTDDACVPIGKIPEFMDATYKLFKKHKLDTAIWGSAGEGRLHVHSACDLTKDKIRTKALQLADDFAAAVIKLGGTPSSAHGDGLLRGSYIEKLYGSEMYDLLREVKQICDPQGIFNPSAKFVDKKALAGLMRHEYSLGCLANYELYM